MSYINQVQNFITGYDVVASDNGDGRVKFVLQDPNFNMRDGVEAKAILMKAAQDWLTANSGTEAIYTDGDQCQKCPGSNSNVDFYYGSKTLVVTTAAAKPGAPETATVPLPLACDTAVTFA